jgi:hypothetical protein
MRSFKTVRIIPLIAIGIFIYFLIAEVLYWTRRLPRNIAHTIKSNEGRVDGVVSGVNQYYNFHGYVPSTIHDLERGDNGRRWILLANDAWGRLLHYEVIGSGSNIVVRVWSYGADGKPGGEGSAADLYREWQPNKADKPNRVIMEDTKD